MNYFATPTAAKQYQQGRPDFHAASIARARSFMGLTGKVHHALDVACGTGLSTKALLEIAEHVTGTDGAAHMVAHAYMHERIQYHCSPAEHQPFAGASFDIITVCSGVHWFHIDAFLAECLRLLRPGGWLVLYDNFFLGDSRESPGFRHWYETIYKRRFPAPKRNNQYDWSSQHLATLHFDLRGEEQFENEVVFTKEALIQYFITQSNIISAVNAGETTYEAATAWLDAQLHQFYPTPASLQSITFGNWIRYMRPLQPHV